MPINRSGSILTQAKCGKNRNKTPKTELNKMSLEFKTKKNKIATL